MQQRVGTTTTVPPPLVLIRVDDEPLTKAACDTETREPTSAAKIRDHVEAHRAEILACAGRPLVVIEASVDAKGIAHFALASIEAQTEQRCVQELLGAPRVGGSPGMIRFPLRSSVERRKPPESERP